MPAADETSDGDCHDAVEQLRHDLKTPLTTIHGRAYLWREPSGVRHP